MHGPPHSIPISFCLTPVHSIVCDFFVFSYLICYALVVEIICLQFLIQPCWEQQITDIHGKNKVDQDQQLLKIFKNEMCNDSRTYKCRHVCAQLDPILFNTILELLTTS